MTKHAQHTIAFSPPDITQAEIDAVAQTLQSGWITTGPATKELEKRLREFTCADGLACLNSATASLEGVLRILGIGPGDEVIVPAYTYTATASPVCHIGATLVLCDVKPNSVQMNLGQLEELITERTKAVIGVDIAGIVEDYAGIESVLLSKADLWHPATDMQRTFDRAIMIADAAHSLGARQGGAPSGSIADFTCFSFHAVKNFTTAEGGALAWRKGAFDTSEMYKQVMLYSLHGQTKDALSKTQVGGWEYDIAYPGYKCNMTDIQASLGLAQLDRYPHLLARRREIVKRYEDNLSDAPVQLLNHFPSEGDGKDSTASSAHLMITRVEGIGPDTRNQIIETLAQQGIASNVHYKPLPLLTAYASLGFSIDAFPHAYDFYQNEITLPLHTLLSDEDVDFICQAYKAAIEECQ